jgi:hypothetical protein
VQLLTRNKSSQKLMIRSNQAGKTGIEVKYKDETIWFTQKLMAELFDVGIPTINEHIKNIYEERELDAEATIRKFRIVQNEGECEVGRNITYYNLDAIISVGYRVNSTRATQFRQWATNILD